MNTLQPPTPLPANILSAWALEPSSPVTDVDELTSRHFTVGIYHEGRIHLEAVSATPTPAQLLILTAIAAHEKYLPWLKYVADHVDGAAGDIALSALDGLRGWV